jgi:ubiquinone/menaquinone biosynthesis C-methylase UbiE
MRKYKGRIDEIEDLSSMDLVAFHGSNPWANQFITGGFKAGPKYYRTYVEKWGFTDLDNVADIGSGYGRWAVFLGEVNGKVTGYERNAEAVALSNKLAEHFALPDVRFETAEVTKIPAPDESVDAAWCFNGLHLFPRADCLKEAHRILKPGAPIFFGAYNALGGVLDKFFEGYARGGMADYVTKFALRSLKETALPEANGGTCADAESIGAVLRHHGFELSHDHPIDAQMRPKAVQSPLYADELKDVPALAARLETDEAFREEFAKHPEIAQGYPVNLNFLAVRL